MIGVWNHFETVIDKLLNKLLVIFVNIYRPIPTNAMSLELNSFAANIKMFKRGHHRLTRPPSVLCIQLVVWELKGEGRQTSRWPIGWLCVISRRLSISKLSLQLPLSRWIRPPPPPKKNVQHLNKYKSYRPTGRLPLLTIPPPLSFSLSLFLTFSLSLSLSLSHTHTHTHTHPSAHIFLDTISTRRQRAPVEKDMLLECWNSNVVFQLIWEHRPALNSVVQQNLSDDNPPMVCLLFLINSAMLTVG